MNFATSLELPSLAPQIQTRIQEWIRYSPVLIKAFNKTIAPEILSTVMGVSGYYIECGRGAGCMAMKAAGITHNPLQAAVRSAYAELTSTEAHATYQQITSLTKARAIDAVVIGLCATVAIAEGIDLAQRCYRAARAFYGRFYPVDEPTILPSVELALNLPLQDEEQLSAIVADINTERFFLAEFDRIDADALCAVCIQVEIAQIKIARARLALALASAHAAQSQLAYVVDKAIEFTIADKALQRVPLMLPAATELQPKGKASAKRKSRTKAQPTGTTTKGTTAKPKRTPAKARANSKQ
jgi:hypothetical protein